MQIGEVAQRTGLTQRTLRYYEAIGLLEPATRLEGGFRLYSDDDLARLERIMELKQLLGFSLAEIKQIVDADDVLRQIRRETKQQPDPQGRRIGWERAVGILEEQLTLVRQRIGAMQELEERYERRLERLRGRLASLDTPELTGMLERLHEHHDHHGRHGSGGHHGNHGGRRGPKTSPTADGSDAPGGPGEALGPTAEPAASEPAESDREPVEQAV